MAPNIFLRMETHSYYHVDMNTQHELKKWEHATVGRRFIMLEKHRRRQRSQIATNDMAREGAWPDYAGPAREISQVFSFLFIVKNTLISSFYPKTYIYNWHF